ncbi:MAG TPA: 30S ribosomal protein S4 [Candidatus Desulfofervidus auxilii]|uniref:Small ribosomal subunit protein uS4 n=1 Tax=Desulfofervidus auxilii TaxID=1621989 RepID=A0A7C0U4B8_DESA2|nr:30S ribosomal protein S4 [Candidatus Desulfofervidus auxilii]
MARYTGPVCRLCRREGVKLFLKGERCYTDKCALERRPYPPGQHGQMRIKKTDYGILLREKQKLKRIYGILEKQFHRYFEEAVRLKGITGENLLMLLERRLDNVVYRMGFANSRRQARQLVRHGHVLVNDEKVDIPSYLVEVGDIIKIREKSKDIPFIKEALEAVARRGVPSWLEVDKERLEGRVKALPTRDEIAIPVQEQLIVEFYSK